MYVEFLYFIYYNTLEWNFINLFPAFLKMQVEASEHEKALMTQKLITLRLKINEPFPLCHQLIPLDAELLTLKKQQLCSLLQTELAEAEIDKFSDIILGLVEGISGNIDLKDHLTEHLGVYNQILSKFIESKTQIKFYGTKKQKHQSLREVKEVELLNPLFDIKEIKSHRKMRLQYRSTLKAITKFVEQFQKKIQTQSQQLFQLYTKAYGQEIKLKQLTNKLKDSKIVKKQSPPIILENIEEIKKQELIAQIANQDLKKQEKEMKSKKQKKKDKVKEKQKQKEKEKEKNKEEEIKGQKIDDQKLIQAATVKKSKQNQQKLQNFFKTTPKAIKKETMFKQQAIDQNLIIPEEQNLIQNNNYSNKMSQLTKIMTEKPLFTIQQLQCMFYEQTKNHIQKNTNYISNIYIWDSKIRYEYHCGKNLFEIDFTEPCVCQDQIRYFDDSYQIYEQENAESIAQGNENQMDEEESDIDSGVNTIVPDGYLSDVQLSSQESCKQMKMVKLLNGKQQLWYFAKEENQYSIPYQMVCLVDQNFPLRLKQEEKSDKDIVSLSCRMQLLKEIHGSYGSKDALISKLVTITDKMSKNQLNNMIKEVSIKNSAQRSIKQQIIEEIKEIKEDFEIELKQIKQKKDQQIRQTQEMKNLQKYQKLEKVILEYEGSMYIIELMKYLKEKKQCKFTKKELQQFINSRQGERWEQIKKQLVKIRRKEVSVQPINEMLKEKAASQIKKQKIPKNKGLQIQQENKDQENKQCIIQNIDKEQQVDQQEMDIQGQEMIEEKKQKKQRKQKKQKKQEQKVQKQEIILQERGNGRLRKAAKKKYNQVQ